VYETALTPAYLDPSVSFSEYDLSIIQNVYEPLVFYNGSCSTCVIPWLAQSYSASSDLSSYNFTLRSGIRFADGEPLNSTAVYFGLNRLLLFDGSTPVGHGTQAAWVVQQMLNKSLSSTLSGSQTYNQQYLNSVLSQNFVQVTGPLTLTVHLQNPNAAFGYIMAGVWGSAIAPNYVIQQDLTLWNDTKLGYSLPFPHVSGDTMTKFKQYFRDLLATCNAGATPAGCAASYLDGSFTGSLAGTGPYSLQSFDSSSNNILLKANPTYWGGPFQFSGSKRIDAKIQTVQFKFVPDQVTRDLDLQNAAKSGQAMAIDVANSALYDVADRSSWLNQNRLVPVIPGTTIYGPFNFFGTLFDPFDTNVTNVLTGQYYKFQPFADLRFRLSFADSVNMTKINLTVNNKLAPIAINVVPPGIPPTGSFNANAKPIYGLDPLKVQNLLLDAMQHPLTSFKFTNGSAAKPGIFDNTFGCATLNSAHQCDHPVPQTIQMYFPTGDTVNEGIFNQIASTINNVSGTYNMGLIASVVPLPLGQLTSEAFAVPNHFYLYSLGYEQDYPWVIDFLGPMYAPGQAYPGPDGWNIGQMQSLYNQAIAANSKGNLTGVKAVGDKMNQIANNMVMYLWTFYTTNFMTMTSNVQGFYYNPSINPAGPGGVGPQYLATLY
jgi:ABC-type transport system substrate-binding protein